MFIHDSKASTSVRDELHRFGRTRSGQRQSNTGTDAIDDCLQTDWILSDPVIIGSNSSCVVRFTETAAAVSQSASLFRPINIVPCSPMPSAVRCAQFFISTLGSRVSAYHRLHRSRTQRTVCSFSSLVTMFHSYRIVRLMSMEFLGKWWVMRTLPRVARFITAKGIRLPIAS